jgi:DNA sulfur modification protein DndC
MEAMIKNDDEKVWMTPLLELRNELGDFSQERSRRDYRRMHGRVELFGKDEENLAIIRGPYTKKAREFWLRRVLETQVQIRRLGPPEFRDIELVSMAELQEIRNLWLYDKHEFDDSLPAIYEEVTGQAFPRPALDDNPLGSDDWQLLKQVCGDDEQFFELQASLLDIEREFRGMSRRAGIYEKLEDRLQASQFSGEDEALTIRRDEERRRRSATAEAAAGQRTLFEEDES